ncbi:MAG: ACT domain-containing protein [Spirochaetales bacterium]|nr:ACT domain-containing protein [Spirochaetales bacterium]
MRAIITVVGKDQVGIIAKISTILADSKINILDINQTILQNYFTMMMLVDLSGINTEIAELRNTLDNLGKELTLSITLQQEEIFHAMHRID